MEERSPEDKPSGDWKPYQRDKAPAGDASDPRSKDPRSPAEGSGDWKPYERRQARESGEKAETSETSGGWKPYESEKDRQPREELPADRGDKEKRSDPDDEKRSDHEPSKVDAMGQDKHRDVIGQRYGASRGRQFLYYGIFLAVVIGGYIGLKTASESLDKAPAKDRDQAPWSKPEATDEPLGGFEPSSPNQKGATDFQ